MNQTIGGAAFHTHLAISRRRPETGRGFLRSFDLRPELPAITARTLILAGRHDWICQPEFSEEIHCIIKDSQLRIFEKSSHSIRNDEPELLRETIVDFVGRGA